MPYDVRVYRGDSTLSLNRTQDALNDLDARASKELIFYGKASGSISLGDIVQFIGTQGDHILFKKANAAEVIDFPQSIIGIAKSNIASGSFGDVVWFGTVSGVNTVTPNWSAGDILYFDNSTGNLTNIEPTIGSVKVSMAAVQKEATSATASNGIILVRPNVIENGHNIFIQDTAPIVVSGYKYLWIDTSGAYPVFNVHDGSSTFQGKLAPL